MKIRKMLAILLIVFQILTIMPAMAFADTTKVTDTQRDNKKNTDVTGHWASGAIAKWSGVGVIKGDGNSFRPDDPITRAEMAVILNNLMGYQKKADNLFKDVDHGAWYADSILKANAAGILNGDGAGHAAPNANITREQAVVMLARAFGVDNSSANKTSFKDAGKISLWAQPLVFGMEAYQYIGGKSNGNFESKANITRAEVVKIIDNAVKEYYTTSGTYTTNVSPTNHGGNCVAIVKADGVIVKGAKITGDLIIAEGVGNGNVTLDGAMITGKLLARGGGKNSIHIINGAQVNGRVSVERVDGTVRIVSNGVTISTLEADTEVILEGSFTNVVVAEGATVQVKGQVKNISVEAKALLTIGKDATVDTIAVEKGAIGAKVDVSGTVNTIKTDAPKTEIKVTETAKVTKVEATTTATGTNVSLDKSAEVKTLNSDSTITTSGEGTPKAIAGNGKVTNSGTAKTETTASSSGGGGGGGSTGSGGGSGSGANTGGSTGDGGGGNTVPTPTVLVESVTLNKKAINIEAGKTELLVATVLPVNATNKTVTWSSDNKEVSIVDSSGLVSAIKAGTAVITATTVDGNKMASCIITVDASPAITLDSIVIDTSAAKTIYTVGDALDLSGLVVTGTYSNGTIKKEKITAKNITGFNSTVAANNQILTITIDGKIATYSVDIKEVRDIWEYTVNTDNTLTITKYLGNQSNVEIPYSIDGRIVTKLEDYEYSQIKNITIPSSVEYIDTTIFYRGLIENINIDSNNNFYKSVDGILFNKSMDKLIAYPMGNDRDKYYIPDGVTTIGFNAFATTMYNGPTSLKELYIPSSIKSIADTHSIASRLENIYVDDKNTVYKSIDGVLFSKSGDELVCYPYLNNRTEYFIPEGTRNISFEDSFGTRTFLKTLKLPASLETIPMLGFDIYTLENIYINEDNPNFQSLDGVLFSKDLKTLVEYPMGNLRISYSIPYGVTKVNYSAFKDGCHHLKDLTIPSTLVDLNGGSIRIYLENVFVAEDHPTQKSISGVLFSKDGKSLIYYPRLKENPVYSIPEGTQTLEHSAFFACNLSTLIIPDSVIFIKPGSIQWNDHLKDVVIYNNEISINEYNFQGCKGVTLWGEKGSRAETYANAMSIPFAAIIKENPDCVFGVINSITKIINKDNNTVQKITGFIDRNDFTKLTIADNVAQLGDTGELYKFEMNAKGEVTAITQIDKSIHDNETEKAPCLIASFKIKEAGISSDRTMFEDNNGKLYKAESNTLVYKAILDEFNNIDRYEVARLSDIEPSDYIWMYDTKTGENHNGTANVIIYSSTKENSDCIFGVINSITKIINKDNNTVQKVVGIVKGKEFTKLTIADNVAQLGDTGELYKFEMNAKGEVTAITQIDKSIHDNETEKAPCLIASFKIKEAGISSDRTMFEDNNGKLYKAESNTLVYKAILDKFNNIDRYEVARLSDIEPSDYIWMYDTKTGENHNGTANVIIYSNSSICP